jgi:Xaa-Pro aminopeptidase
MEGSTLPIHAVEAEHGHRVARQHGALEHSDPPAELDAVRLYRLGRLRSELRRHDVAGLLLFDQINTRYATDATNMQVWSSHYETRCVFVALDGPVVLFDYADHPHLAEGLPTVDEYRVMPSFYYFAAGPHAEDRARRFADQIADLMRRHGGGNRRLAVDRLSHLGTDALRAQGLQLLDGLPIAEHARAIKSPGEVALMRASLAVCEEGCRAMRAALVPGITENALWAKLHETNIRLGGEWIETRLLSSGPRTNPWFRECSMRRIEAGDMVSFDTDLIGPYGYCSDISRAWVVRRPPDRRAAPALRRRRRAGRAQHRDPGAGPQLPRGGRAQLAGPGGIPVPALPQPDPRRRARRRVSIDQVPAGLCGEGL